MTDQELQEVADALKYTPEEVVESDRRIAELEGRLREYNSRPVPITVIEPWPDLWEDDDESAGEGQSDDDR